MKKRMLAWLLLLTWIMGIFAGCDNAVTTPTEPSQNEYPKNVTKIVMTYQTMSTSNLQDLSKVEAAINEISAEAIGVVVELRPIDAVEAFSAYSSWISNGQTVDLMVLNYQDILGYISKDMLIPIDHLLQSYGEGIQSIIDEGYPLTEGSVMDGKTYGVISVPSNLGGGGGLWLPKRYLDEVGFAYDAEKIYSMQELDCLFGLLKEKYPDKYPLGQITSASQSSTMSFYLHASDSLGTSMTSGGIINDKTNRIENIFASEQYAEFLQYLRKWYKMGYIYPEAATTDATIHELAASGIVMSYPLSSTPGIISESIFGEETVCLRTTEVTSGAQYSKAGFWTIPVTSSSPVAAMKFLNLMITDERIGNLLSWGIEGEHYVVTDRENLLICYPDGVDATTVSYANPLGLYGDRRKVYIMGTEEMRKEQIAYTQEALANPKGIRGFVYSPTNVKNQLAMLENIVAQYVPVLESGSVDLDVYYPAFLEALEKAGIDEVIADKQAQLDAWLAEQENP